jgi:hypothetical protein
VDGEVVIGGFGKDVGFFTPGKTGCIRNET